MQNYFDQKWPCRKCPRAIEHGLSVTCGGTEDRIGCTQWREWFRAVWPRTCKFLKVHATHSEKREVWRYYSPDEIETMRRRDK